MSADPNILRTQTPDGAQAPAAPSIENIELPDDHAGNHPDPKVQEKPREIFSTPLTEAVTEDAEGRKLINPVPDTVAGLPEANNVTQVTDPHTGARRFVVGQTVETGYRPPVTPSVTAPPATQEKKSRKGLWISIGAAGTAAVAGLVFMFQGGGSDQRVSSEHDNQGDTKATSQAAAPTAGEASPTSAAETQETPAAVNYTIDTVAANADPKAYYEKYATAIGMTHGTRAGIDQYFDINNRTKSGETEQSAALDEMRTFLGKEIGNNFSAFATAIYDNPDLTPLEVDRLISNLGPYVFAAPDQDVGVQASLRDFARQLQQAPRGMTIMPNFANGGGPGVESTVSLGVFAAEEANASWYAAVVDPDTKNAVAFVGRPGAMPGVNDDQLTLLSTNH